jgi:hypothetical protein
MFRDNNDRATGEPPQPAAPSRYPWAATRTILVIACLAAALFLISRSYRQTHQHADLHRHLWTTPELLSLCGKTEADVVHQMGENYEIRLTSSRYCGLSYLWRYEHLLRRTDENWVDDDSTVDVVFCDRKVYEVRYDRIF